MYIHYIFIIYTILMGISSVKNKKVNKILMGGFFIAAFIIAAFRDVSVGNDTLEYVRVFNNIKGISQLYNNIQITRFEYGYVFLNSIIKTFTDNYTILLAMVSAFYLYSVWRFINKYSESIWLSTFLFYILGNYFLIFNLLRQCIAISFFLIAIDFIIEKKPIKYVITIIFASLFHTTSIILLPVYFIRRWNINYKVIMVYFIVTLMGVIEFDNIINIIIKILPQYSHYFLNSKYSLGGIKLASIVNCLRIIAIYFLCKIISINYKDFDKKSLKGGTEIIKINVFESCVILCIIVLILSIKFNLLDRIADYFSIVLIVYLPNIICKLKREKCIVYYVIIVFLIIYSTIIIYYRPEWSGIFPYKFK